MHTINTEFVVQVWATGHPGCADIANDFALADPLPFTQAARKGGHVAVEGCVCALVTQNDHIAVTVLAPYGIRRHHLLLLILVPVAAPKSIPLWARQVCSTGWKRAVVKPEVTRENSSGDRRNALRIFLPSAVVTTAIIGTVPERAVGVAVVHELCGQDAASTDWLAQVRQHFIDDAEAITLA